MPAERFIKRAEQCLAKARTEHRLRKRIILRQAAAVWVRLAIAANAKSAQEAASSSENRN
jgi:hypothetical protein